MKTLRKLMATVLVLVTVITAIPMSNLTANAANGEATWISVDFNEDAPKKNGWYDGMLLSQQKIDQLSATVLAHPQVGEGFNVPVKIKEKGKYLHANKNGTVKLTFFYDNLTKVETVKIGIEAKKLTVKATKTPLYEGQILTNSDALKATKRTAEFSDGKKRSNFKGAVCKEVGKTVKANKKGLMKLNFSIGGCKASVWVKVIPIKKIQITKANLRLTKGQQFVESAFKSVSTVRAKYTDGKKKVLKTYSVSAAKTVTGEKFPIKVKYVGRTKKGKKKTFTDSVSLKVDAPAKPTPQPPAPGPNPDPVPVKKEYDVTVKVQGFGSVLMNGSTASQRKVTAGSVVIFKAKPGENSELSHWLVNGKKKEGNPLKETINQNTVVEAIFTEKQVTPPEPEYATLSVSIEGEGKVFANGEDFDNKEVVLGTEFDFVPEAAEGWRFLHWLVNGMKKEENPLTETIDKDTDVKAVFEKIPMGHLTLKSNSLLMLNGEEVEFEDDMANFDFEIGTDIELLPLEVEPYRFAYWMVNNEIMSSNLEGNGISFKMEENITVEAFFSEWYFINVNENPIGGHVENTNWLPDQEFCKGYLLNMDAVPDDGYAFVKWVDSEGNTLGEEPTLNWEVDGPITITPIFRQLAGKVSVSSNGGIVKIDKKEIAMKPVPVGTASMVTAEDTEHFKFFEWTDDAGNKISSREYSFIVSEEREYHFEATFIEVYQLTTRVENGVIKLGDEVLSDTRELPKGTHHLVVEPDEGYEVENWIDEEGNELGSGLEIDIQLDKNKTVTCNLKKIECTLTLGVTENAKDVEGVVLKVNGTTVQPGELLTFEYGTKITLKESNPNNLQFVGWTNGEEKLPATATFTIKSDMTVTAVFNTVYKLTLRRVGGKGRILMNGQNLLFEDNVYEEYVVPGNIPLESISNDDYTFVSYMGVNSSNTPETSPKINFSMPARDVEIIVNFRESDKTVEVTFVTQYGEEVLKEAVPFGESVSEIPTYPKFGSTFLGWMLKDDEENEVLYSKTSDSDEEYYSESGEKLSDAIKARTAAKQAVLVTGMYQENPLRYSALNIVGGEIDMYKGLMNEEGLYAEGTHFYLVAGEAPESEEPLYFNGWANEKGEIVCDYAEYDFTMGAEDVFLQTIWSGTPGKPMPRLLWTGQKFEVDASQNTIFFTPKVDIPSNYEVKEWGIILSTKPVDVLADEDITLTTGSAKVAPKPEGSEIYPNNARWELTLVNPALFVRDKLLRSRIYCRIENTNTGETEERYSDEVVSIDFNQYLQ